MLVPGGTSRATVTRNVIQHASIGVNLDGSNSMVDHNCIRTQDGTGSAHGTGVYSDQGLKSSTIDENVFFDNDEAAIVLTTDRWPARAASTTSTSRATCRHSTTT